MNGPVGLVPDEGVGVDAQVVVDGGQDVVVVDRSAGGRAAELVGRADDLADLHAAAGEQGRVDPRPVVAAGVLVDLGRAAELAPDDHRDVPVQTAGVDVLDQGGDPLVEERQMLAELAEVAAVRVPEAVGDRDAPRPGLDQPAGDQELVVPHRGAVAQVSRRADAVAVAEPGVLAGDVEGLGHLVRGQHVEGAAVDVVHPADLGVIDLAAELVELVEQPAAAIESLRVRHSPAVCRSARSSPSIRAAL